MYKMLATVLLACYNDSRIHCVHVVRVIDMTESEQREAAKAFAAKWQGKGYEKGETQKFWLELIRTVYGVENPEDYMNFEVQIQLSNVSFIDVYIPSTKVII